MISCHQAWALFSNLINHWHYFNCFSFLIGFSFDSSIINGSVYPNKLQANIIVFFVFKMVDCSGGEFFVCQFYILLLQYQSSYQNDCFFICNKGLSFQNDFCFSRSLLWPQAPLSSVLVTVTLNGVLFSQSKLPNHWTTVVLFWIPYFFAASVTVSCPRSISWIVI
jgi:hypothetical protein